MMARPARVRMRSRKPCVRVRRRLFGWKVRLPLLTVGSLLLGGGREPAVEDSLGVWTGVTVLRGGTPVPMARDRPARTRSRPGYARRRSGVKPGRTAPWGGAASCGGRVLLLLSLLPLSWIRGDRQHRQGAGPRADGDACPRTVLRTGVDKPGDRSGPSGALACGGTTGGSADRWP